MQIAVPFSLGRRTIGAFLLYSNHNNALFDAKFAASSPKLC